MRDGLECSRRQIKTRRSRPRVIAGTRRDLFLYPFLGKGRNRRREKIARRRLHYRSNENVKINKVIDQQNL